MFECVEPVVFRSCSGDEWYDGSSANVHLGQYNVNEPVAISR